MVEVPGIEPGSEDHTLKASTCLCEGFDLTVRNSPCRDFRTAILLRFCLGAAGVPVDYPTVMTIHPCPWERRSGSVAGY